MARSTVSSAVDQSAPEQAQVELCIGTVRCALGGIDRAQWGTVSTAIDAKWLGSCYTTQCGIECFTD